MLSPGLHWTGAPREARELRVREAQGNPRESPREHRRALGEFRSMEIIEHRYLQAGECYSVVTLRLRQGLID